MEPLGNLLFSLEAQTHIPEDAGSRTSPCFCSSAQASQRSSPWTSLWESALKFSVVSKTFWKGNKILRGGYSVLRQPGGTGAFSEEGDK